MWEEFSNSRTQELPELLHDAGLCYFYNLKKYENAKKIVGYDIPRLFCQDIDTMEDFKNAEIIFNLFIKKMIDN